MLDEPLSRIVATVGHSQDETRGGFAGLQRHYASKDNTA